ncbi:MAG: hypothetical protein A1D16_04050 [Flavihumibacter sp. CACIAM 22H1]|nr:MAG: hypothetical protein A1D16_04050 [Flavihumibacter sp. CACIAM 22H1]
MEMIPYKSLEHLAISIEMPPSTFRKKVEILLSDPEIFKEIRTKPYRRLTPYQFCVLLKYMPDLFHLQRRFSGHLRAILGWEPDC